MLSRVAHEKCFITLGPGRGLLGVGMASINSKNVLFYHSNDIHLYGCSVLIKRVYSSSQN